MTPAVLLLVSATGVQAAGPPRRPVPDPVLAELDDLEVRFERALALDCDETRCFSTGCVYVDHRVSDRPKGGSLPGLGDPAGPGSVTPQPWLTKAQCGFAHEPAIEKEDVGVLTRRLQARVSTGWTSVSVSPKPMDPLPGYFRTDAEAEDEPVPEPEPEPVVAPTPGEQLWAELLPHAFWMIGVLLVTFASMLLIWAFRRVGKASIEEEMLLAQMAAEAGAPPTEAEVVGDDEDALTDAFVEEQHALWAQRLADFDPVSPDLALHALIRDRLRAGDIPFLAKAVLRFPDHFPAIFPDGGDVAAAKLALAEFLRADDTSELPDDPTFFKALARHAVAGRVAAQADADTVRRLREEYGAAGLADTIQGLTPRLGGLLFAWVAPGTQHEVVRLFSPRQVAAMSDQLLRSNRMDARETEQLFAVVRGEGAGSSGRVTDQGAELDVAGALSLLLGRLARGTRNQLLTDALARFHGGVPAWFRQLFIADMLHALPSEARADLLLGVDATDLAAWMSSLESTAADDVRAVMPDALRSTLTAVGVSSDLDARAAAARRGRLAMARAFQAQLSRLGVAYDAVLRGDSGATE